MCGNLDILKDRIQNNKRATILLQTCCGANQSKNLFCDYDNAHNFPATPIPPQRKEEEHQHLPLPISALVREREAEEEGD